jgi:TolB-like protein/class 3 adenylate cyclase/cytochrome c-type biogenesis protein CcmH/NrfG
MSSQRKPDLQLEIAHVLFIDLVGYSKLLINEQHEVLEALNQIVRNTTAFRVAEAARQLVSLPTGDGMALAFATTPEAPVQCALEISQALKTHPEIQLRMGIHSGPVSEVKDVNERSNVAGFGINMAQRVMDCGDAGHILLSKRVADDLAQYRQWKSYLHDLGEFEVKHGMNIHVVNLCTDELGNSQLPAKLRGRKQRRLAAVAVGQGGPTRRRNMLIMAFVLSAVVLLIGLWIFFNQAASKSATTPASPTSRDVISAPEKSIAVLPFENLSHDPENAYFAQGIQDEILTRLAKIADLKVISRTSTQQYQSKPANLPEIAKQLVVANILEGSIQKVGDQVRVNVQLINAKNDSHIWAEIYDRRLTDIFGVESEIAKAIAESLQAKLSGSEEQALVVKPTNNSEAYDAYLRGLVEEEEITRSTRLPPASSLERAIQFYERSVQLDPEFAAAWSRLSRAHAQMYFGGHDVTATRRGAAERTLSTAQKLQPNAPETILAQAYFQYRVLRDYEAAKTTFGRARKMLPGSSEVPAALALITRRQGHWDESIACWEQSLALDPLNSQSLVESGATYRMLRQFQAALNTYDRALNIRPNDPVLITCKAELYQAEGDLEQARKLLAGLATKALTGRGTEPRVNQLVLERHYDVAILLLQASLIEIRQLGEVSGLDLQVRLALVQQLARDSAGARATAQEAQRTLATLCKEEPDSPWLAAALSQIYAVLGEKDAAIREAKRAVALLPSARDAVSGPEIEENLAYVQARCGENDRAISAVQHLLSVPYGAFPITKALLRIDPRWDDLRSDLRFQQLVEEKK